MATTLTFEDTAGATQEIVFDAVETERHEFGTIVTEHPVETGQNVADHVLPTLDRIGLEVFISNQPVFIGAHPSGKLEVKSVDIPRYSPALAPTTGSLTRAIGDGIRSLLSGGGGDKIQVLTFAENLNRPREFYELLQSLRDNALLLRVKSGVREYENMILETVTPIKDRSTGDGMRFSLELRQIRLVDTDRVLVPIPTNFRGSKKQNLGSKSTKKKKDEDSGSPNIFGDTSTLAGF